MLVRVLVLLLLVLNVGAIAWIVSTYDAPAAVVSEREGDIPMLTLLSEREGVPPEPESNPPTISKTDDVCLAIGPFSNQSDLRAAMAALTPLTQRIQFREDQLLRSRGWWVFLPTFPNRSAALDAARMLTERGVKDYYVITAGDQQNTISLGLFRDRTNAEKRQTELKALGLSTQLNERTEQSPGYWIDFAQAAQARFDWRAHVRAADSISERAIDCF